MMKRMFFQKPKSLSYWSSFEEHKLVEMSDQRPESRFGTKDGAWALHIGPHIDGAGRALLSSPQQAASSCPTEDAWDDRELIEMFDEAIRSHRRRGARGPPYARQHQMCGGSSTKRPNREQELYQHQGTDVDDVISTEGATEATGDVNSHRGHGMHQSSYQYPPQQPSGPKDVEYTASLPSAWPADLQGTVHGTDTSVTSLSPSTMPPIYEQVEAALADMMNAWYQSGYMTGRYYTLLEMQQQYSGSLMTSSSSAALGGTSHRSPEDASPSKRLRK